MLYAEDAVLEDPVGTPAHVGREAIRNFYKTGFDNTGAMNFVWDGPIRGASLAAIAVSLRRGQPW